uniref:AMP-binding protein n=1 Tax=Nocardia donostiensis TaxID=1538463 RepID=UPI001FEAA7ED|nr:AMP-binding protein [Nocardia donostiensis]
MRRMTQLCAEYDDVRRAMPRPEVAQEIHEPGKGLAQIIETVMVGYADRPALGQRATEIHTDEATGRASLTLLPHYRTTTYGELWERVRAGDFVAMLGFTSSDYATLDLATTFLGLVAVPLQPSASVAGLTAIVNETEPRLLAATPELLDTAVTCALSSPPLRRLLVFDYHPGDDDQRATFDTARARLADAGSPVVVESFDEVLTRGRGLPPAPLYRSNPDEDPLALLLYTSGSTGTPKGAMYTERLVIAGWLSRPDAAAINFNYLPLSHLAGCLSLTGALARGGTAYFAAKSDMSTLFDDIALARPTEFLFVPRVCDMVFQRFLSEVERRGNGVDRKALEAEVKAELHDHFLGGRLIMATCGSAPVSAEMKSFMESVLGLPMRDGYGSTEAGGNIMADNQLQRPPVLDYKLVDVPELGYFRTDKPYPHGELLLKCTTMIPGYYKRPEVTAQVFDEDGFYKTGDIVAETAPDRLVYVDRRNNVLKLSQGEFVAVAHLEAVYSTSPLIRQIFVYGSSERAYTLAVIVPTDDALSRGGSGQGENSAQRVTAAARQGRRPAQLRDPARLPDRNIPRELIEKYGTDLALRHLL